MFLIQSGKFSFLHCFLSFSQLFPPGILQDFLLDGLIQYSIPAMTSLILSPILTLCYILGNFFGHNSQFTNLSSNVSNRLFGLLLEFLFQLLHIFFIFRIFVFKKSIWWFLIISLWLIIVVDAFWFPISIICAILSSVSDNFNICSLWSSISVVCCFWHSQVQCLFSRVILDHELVAWS